MKRFALVDKPPKALPVFWDDAGRGELIRDGVLGRGEATGDCAVRAIAIALEQPYMHVVKGLDELMRERLWYGSEIPDNVKLCTRGTPRRFITEYLAEHGWVWVPVMGIGTGCRVHLAEGELPACPLIARLSQHVTVVQYGSMVFDADERVTRGGTRCVYGLWRPDPNVRA